MAHTEQRLFIESVKEKFPSFFRGKKVLDIGSLNINGSARDFFEKAYYTGIDIGPGPGVDLVAKGEEFDAADSSFDVVLSCECFEHNPAWKETFLNMIRLCKNKGLLFFTCATDGRPEHGTSNSNPNDSPLTTAKGIDYYKNLNEADFLPIIDFTTAFIEHCFLVNPQSQDLYFYGVVKKRSVLLTKLATLLRNFRK